MKSLRQPLRIGAIAFLGMLAFAVTLRTLLLQSPGPQDGDVDRAKRRTGTSKQSDFISGNGVVEPSLPETRLATDVPGRISAIYVKEGEKVTKGALLAELDNVVQRAQVFRAEAGVTEAQADFQRVNAGMRSQDINAVVAEADAAKARAALAQSDFARTSELFQKGGLTDSELEQSKRRAEVETASLKGAEQRARAARAGSRKEEISVAQARLKAATAGLEESRGALMRTQIFAPSDWQILRVKFHAGEYHNPSSGDPLLIFGDVSQLRVRVDVDERDVARIQPGASATVTCPAFQDRSFTGKVVEIGKRMGRRTIRVDEPTDRMDVKILEASIELDGPPPLFPGMRVTARISTK